MVFSYNSKLTKRANKLRRQSTLSEILLWKKLRAGQILGYKFNRQKPIGNYIVDFYCKELKLAIEIDGSTHFDQADYDSERDAVLKRLGVSILKFGDIQVKQNCYGVVEQLKDWIKRNYPPRPAGTPPQEGTKKEQPTPPMPDFGTPPREGADKICLWLVSQLDEILTRKKPGS